MFKTLFGTLDEQTRRKILKLIEINANETRKIAELLVKQIEIILTVLDNNDQQLSNINTIGQTLSTA